MDDVDVLPVVVLYMNIPIINNRAMDPTRMVDALDVFSAVAASSACCSNSALYSRADSTTHSPPSPHSSGTTAQQSRYTPVEVGQQAPSNSRAEHSALSVQVSWTGPVPQHDRNTAASGEELGQQAPSSASHAEWEAHIGSMVVGVVVFSKGVSVAPSVALGDPETRDDSGD